VQAAPAGLAVTVAAAAAKGAAASSSTLTLIKGALKVMAWAKAKTVILTGAAVILAAGTTAVFVRNGISHSQVPPFDESIWNINSAGEQARLDRLPPMLVIRQRPGPPPPLGGVSLSFGGKLFEKEMSLKRLLSAAYRRPEERMIVPNDFSGEQFDVLLTFQDRPEERLQEGVEKQLGLAAHRETLATDVLLLRVKNANAPGLQRNLNSPAKPAITTRRGEVRLDEVPLTVLASHLQAHLDMPVVDQTGLTGRFNMDLRWPARPGEKTNGDALKQAVLNQLGLELVPGREPIEMLVVEKVK
jgi:uncharacterized protein (TIGR03435 family)